MQKEIKVTFLVNAAVLLEYAGVKMLIDGIYDHRGHIFSNLSTKQWENLIHGKEEFSNIEYLLFTHEHGDHFSPERVRAYLQQQNPKAIFMPQKGSEEIQKLEAMGKERGINCVMLEESFCKEVYFKLETNIKIKAYHTVHLDEIYRDIEHYCYLIQCGDKNLFFTSDVAFNIEEFVDMKDIELDAVFVNPVMYQSKRGKQLLECGNLQAKTVVVYHIPFAENDNLGLRKMIERRIVSAPESTKFFMQKGQTLIL